ncbi:MAG TPA: hypothetical protein VGK58_21900 [Lacipirellulaceae bacterium]
MLKLWRKNRKRRDARTQTSDVGWRARRRLGFEAMEGRLMLSGDVPDFVSWDAYSPQFSLALYPPSAAPLQTAPVEIVDGGFITTDAVLFGPSAQKAFDSVTNLAYFRLSGLSSDIVITNNSASRDWSLNFTGVHLDTPAIPLIVFPTGSDLDTTFVDQPADAGPQPVEVTVDEGGAIPINSILAFVGHTDSWKRGEQLASTPRSQTGDVSLRIASVVQRTQSREIAGEWARPVMLEMAGGEPIGMRQPETSQNQRAPASDGDDNLRFRRSLSSGAAGDASATDSRAGRDMDSSHRNTATHPDEDAQSAIRRTSSTQQPVPIVLASHTANGQLSQSATVEPSKLASLDSGSAERGALDESAFADVYDRLGTSDAVGEAALFNRDTWRDSWKATPLLMILALERIAASNSRRAKRESSYNAGRPQSTPQASADLTDPV